MIRARGRGGAKWLGVVLMAASLAAVVATAGAAPPTRVEEARKKTAEATAAYNLGQYDEAAQLYEQAYRLHQDASLLFNIGQSYRLAKRADKALTAYRAYLRTAGPNVSYRTQAEKRVREMEAAVAATPSAQARASEPAIPPPPPKLLDVAAASPAPASVAPAAPAAVAAVSARREPSGSRWWMWTAIGAGAALVLGGVAIAVAASRGADLPRTALGHEEIFR